jgi:hypothetical protein
MGWCKANCPGNQHSDLSQWLQPLTSWVAPYIGLLLLCPFGDIKKRPTLQSGSQTATRLMNAWRWFWDLVREYTQEWINLLGDPASAIFGAFSEIWSDAATLREINPQRVIWPMRLWKSERVPSSDLLWLKLLRWVIVLVGDTEFNQPSEQQGGKGRISQEHGDQRDIHMLPLEKTFEITTCVPSQSNSRVADDGREAMVENAIRAHIEARTDFFKAVFLPTILFLAVTASVFYDAYTKLGDNDTADALAFGVWYSWLVILSVAGNCFASSVNAGLTETTLGQYIQLSKRSVPLRERYFNSLLWDEWLVRIENDWEQTLSNSTSSDIILFKLKDELKLKAQGGNQLNRPTLTLGRGFQLLVGHFFAWLCVAMPTAAAIVVSWVSHLYLESLYLSRRDFQHWLIPATDFDDRQNTPTVGLDCRSFNFLLYGIMAFIAPPLHVGYQWTRHNNRNKYLKEGLKWTYWLLVCANAAVITIGTILQLSGVYRSCQCQLLFASDTELVEINRNTSLAVGNAQKYWLPVGYVAFGFVWVVCGLVTAARKYITIHLVAADEQD